MTALNLQLYFTHHNILQPTVKSFESELLVLAVEEFVGEAERNSFNAFKNDSNHCQSGSQSFNLLW